MWTVLIIFIILKPNDAFFVFLCAYGASYLPEGRVHILPCVPFKKKGRFTIMFKNGYNTLLISLFIHAYILSICFRSSTKKLQHIHICYKITEEKNCQGKIISTICNSFSLIVIWFQFKTIFFKSESSETSTSLRKNKAYAMEMIW